MKKFKFRLEPVLRLRQQREDLKKCVVGELMTEIAQQQRLALEMSNTVAQQGDVLKDKFARGDIDLGWISYYQRFVSNMRGSIAQKIDNVGKIQQKLTAARVELAEAARQRRIIEKLKEKQQDRYNAEARCLETRQMNEMAENIFHHKKLING